MKIFKFGGASVKDSDAVRNVSNLLARFSGEKLTVVVSAMGKSTNKLEEIVHALVNRDKNLFDTNLEELTQFHTDILGALFTEKHYKVYQQIDETLEIIANKYDQPIPDNKAFLYDQIVSLGEVLSTFILTAYLQEEGHKAKWMDARKLIRTNSTFQEGKVDWNKTEELIHQNFLPQFDNNNILITQGFIGHTAEGFTTTLGREGSDYTAGIFAYCTNAESVTIWKDVPGMLNADPKYFKNTVKLDSISFKEAIELSYYGASVIHPKTIQPLQKKNIPLYVKSFLNPEAEGTIIQQSTEKDNLVPSFIIKKDQVLFSFTTKDFSFIVEENLSDIFDKLTKANVTMNLMQNSALDFSILVDSKKVNIEEFTSIFSNDYHIKYNSSLELATIRHYNEATIAQLIENKEVLLEQRTRHTVRLVLKEKSSWKNV
jgi:aspartate kinase